ncbi:hypothetical protein [Erythrobacter sp. F6033]|uniref:hypothetical protein n=1 Tax=Erythrobacter sp. F6033 TaxID=2926401 RepID=UPI001FF6E6C1|nr:hypothetical protein [Erythrobacter sp. F6033]MCK0129487.1 hypothetical protein [Erythrobacter sp. F6033]
MGKTELTASALAAAIALAGCSAPDTATPDDGAAATPQDEFWTALSSHCGNAFAGKLVSEDAADADFAEAEMVMHVRECSDDRIAIPFHVAADGEWDRSRTWLITRTETGLRLKHDHRHEDGTKDAVTMYGGDTDDAGSATSQDFPVDAESTALFEREGLAASVTNVWTVAVDDADVENGVFAYQLKRTVDAGAPEDRFFRVEFDLSETVDAPLPAWGWE